MVPVLQSARAPRLSPLATFVSRALARAEREHKARGLDVALLRGCKGEEGKVRAWEKRGEELAAVRREWEALNADRC